METAKLANVKLSDIITSTTNEMFRDKSELTAEAIIELTDSVKQVGIIQPILLRPLKNNKFELVCGERRFRAAGYANLVTIPANIRELTDQEALDIQITENLQRKDVHPAREAKAYKMMMTKAKCTINELAIRFGKTEHYIAIRVKLNDLVPEAMKDFHEGLMSLGHALLIARLDAVDQQEVIKQCTSSHHREKQRIKYYETIHELEDFINESIICNLATASFKKDDVTLLPKAGGCISCVKRSGANQLFADMEDKDRCFDRSCFKEKKLLHVAKQINELIETKPDIVYLERKSEKLHPAVIKALQEHKIKSLREDSDFETYSWNKGAKIKGLMLNGDDAGKVVIVYDTKRKGSSASSSSAETGDVDPKEAIAKIKERLERAEELDAEKVYGKVLEALANHPTQKAPEISYYNGAEDAFMNFILYDKMNYSDREEFAKIIFKLKDDDDYEVEPDALYQKLANLDTAEKIFMVRKIMLSAYGGNIPQSNSAFIIKKIAEAYKDIPLAQFETEQNEVRQKREANAAKRVEALKPIKQVTKAKVVVISLPVKNKKVKAA